QSQAWMGSLRGAMDVDHMDPCGVYVGTTTGDVFVSADNGDHWKSLPCALPRVLWVSAFIDP
ncbi:MAG: exo-alpha-sialidase, partial [Planctomycetota bacterium]